ncbi:MAG: AMP-binding protein [Deltaproteobacteria bacterium]|nr:AMP-binding protein [Deltaproteobacteria bacterium]
MIRSMNVAWWVDRWAELAPERPALIFEGETIRYAELKRRADKTACWLQSLGVEKSDRVAVLLENCPEFLELYLACAKLGAIFVPLNFRLTGTELGYLLSNSRPRLLVFGERFAPTLVPLDLSRARPPLMLASPGDVSAVLQGVEPFSDRDAFEGRQPFLTATLGPTDPEEPHVIMYTSGTTGHPKGAVLSHRKTFFNCLNADIFFNLQSDDVMLIVLPLFHSGGLFIQSSPALYKGATILLHPRFNAEDTYRDIEVFGVTKFQAVPTVFKALLRVPPEKRRSLASLKVSAIGGEKTTPEVLAACREAGFAPRQIMGQTETSILLWASEQDLVERPGTVGKPVFHAEVKVVDSCGVPVSPGVVGEIVVQGSILMKEYWDDPERTQQTIRGGCLHTGDLARVDADGYFYLVDRAKDMYISGGENVYPAEVERVLGEHPNIQRVAVLGVPDEVWGETGHALVIRKEGSELTAQEVLAFCQGRLARYKAPTRVTFCSAFPETALGKVRKQELRKSLENDVPAGEGVAMSVA